MDVTPQELRGSEIKEAWRGYHRDEVDELLERAAITIEGLTQQLATVSSRPAPAPAAAPASSPMPINRDDAEMLQRTLLLAQRAADDAVNEAQAQARTLIEESEARAQSLVGEAEATARRIAESERRRLEDEILMLVARRDALQVDADALEEYAGAYRDRVRAAIEADLARLGSGAIDAPSPRPELHDVEIPEPAPVAEPEAFVDSASRAPEAAAPERGASDSGWGGDDDRPGGAHDEPFGSDTRVITIDSSASTHSFSSEPSPSPSPVAAPPRPADSTWPPAPEASASAPGASTVAGGTWRLPTPDAPASAPGATAVAGGTWLDGNDDWAAADADGPFGDALPWEQSTATHEPFVSEPFTSEVAMEANAIDGDSLDDDAFFASLRDAVRDDEPLGPRDDEPNAFFDGEAGDDDRRRFRRRR